MNIDKKITELFLVLEKQKLEVKQLEESSNSKWLTDGLYKQYEYSNRINITQLNEQKLVLMTISLLTHIDYTSKAHELLELEPTTITQGFEYNSWLHDFKKCISIIKLKNKKIKLDQLKDRLDDIVSPEQRRQIELESIVSDLE